MSKDYVVWLDERLEITQGCVIFTLAHGSTLLDNYIPSLDLYKFQSWNIFPSFFTENSVLSLLRFLGI